MPSTRLVMGLNRVERVELVSCRFAEKRRDRKNARKQRSYKQQLSFTSIPVFWSLIYIYTTRNLSSSLLLSGGLALVQQLLFQGCKRQVHLKDVLRLKSIDLCYQCPSPYPGFLLILTDVLCFLPDHCMLHLCSCSSY